MPFKSKAQMRLLYAKEPEVAEEFAEHTPKSDFKNLPEHIRDKNGLKEYTKKHRRRKNA